MTVMRNLATEIDDWVLGDHRWDLLEYAQCQVSEYRLAARQMEQMLFDLAKYGTQMEGEAVAVDYFRRNYRDDVAIQAVVDRIDAHIRNYYELIGDGVETLTNVLQDAEEWGDLLSRWLGTEEMNSKIII